MEEAGARPEETVMIGDSKVDVQTARNAGAWSIGCAFGFAPAEPDGNPAGCAGRFARGVDARHSARA